MPVSTSPELSYPELTFAPSTSIPRTETRRARPACVRRPGSYEQGRALETLGHAVEYLVDSRLRLHDQQAAPGERDAIELLIHLNRAVFSECPEGVPFGRRVRRWFAAHLFRS